MTSIYKYRLYCNTESSYQYTWDTDTPTSCPNNSSHSINTDTITVIDTVSENIIKIKEETVPTQGNFRSEGKSVVCPANTTSTFDFSWPYDINVYVVRLLVNTNNKDDIINCYIAPNTAIGVITQPVSIGDTTITVNSTVLTYIKKGYIITLTDGVNTSILGDCVSIDKVNNNITCVTGSSSAFSQSTPTYLQITVNNIRDITLCEQAVYEIGKSTIGASYVPANTTVRLSYLNNGNVDKTMSWYFDYTY